MKISALTAALALALVTIGMTLTPATPAAQAAAPAMTRAEIIARAESAIGTLYGWGRESWTPNIGGGSGPDCSGYALKFGVPKTPPYQEEVGVPHVDLPSLGHSYDTSCALDIGPPSRSVPAQRGRCAGQERRRLRARGHLCWRRRLELAHHLRGTRHG